jgi:ATP-dependent DNA helicase DinG
MIQGEEGGPERHQMVEELKRNPRSVICGVASFWQGVDLPGDALQLVIVTKVPFPSPGDPLFEAKSERIDAVRPGTFRSFNMLSVPEAVIRLKQGFGRLIRTSTDWGVVAILDSRVITKRYGSTMLGSLPRTPIKYSLGDVAEFFRYRQPEEALAPPSTDQAIDPFDQVPF